MKKTTVKNEVLTVASSNNLKVFDGTFSAENFGITQTDLHRDENGKAMLVNSDGMEFAYNGTGDEMNSLKAVTALDNFRKMDSLVRAYHISRLGNLATNCGFKSVGAFLEKNLELDRAQCNNLYRVGKYIDIDEKTGNASWSMACLRGVTVANLVQCFGAIGKFAKSNEIDNESVAIETFYHEYCETVIDEDDNVIKSARIHWTASLATVKADLQTVFGKSTSKAESKTESKPETTTPETATPESDTPESTTAENEELIIAKAIEVLEKYGLHDLAERVSDSFTKATVK